MASKRPTVVVVGGGIAGLSAAWELSAPGSPFGRVVVLEAAEAFGGKLRFENVGGVDVDVGPDAFVATRPEATELCLEIGLGDELVEPASSGAYVWSRGALRRLPDGLVVGVPTRLGPLFRSGIVGIGGTARAALDLIPPRRRPKGSLGPRANGRVADSRRASARDAGGRYPDADEAVGRIVRRSLGPRVEARLADPLIGGINAGPVDSMSAACVFPSLLEASRSRGSLARELRRVVAASTGVGTGVGAGPTFSRVRGGMSRLVHVLCEQLAARNVELYSSSAVESLAVESPAVESLAVAGGRWCVVCPGAFGAGEDPGGRLEADALVMAAPADEVARLLSPSKGVLRPGRDESLEISRGSVLEALGEMLGDIRQASVSVLTFAFDEAPFPALPPGTGFLVPAEQGMLVTGCTWLSAKWDDLRVPGTVLLRASVGRFGDDRAQSIDVRTLCARVLAELRALMGTGIGEPRDVSVTRWPQAFPQYRVGHLKMVEAMEALAAASPVSLALAGAAYHGVGIPACIGTGRRAARLVSASVMRQGAGT